MENSNYSSLEDSLIQNGIIKDTNEQNKKETENFFEIMKSEIVPNEYIQPQDYNFESANVEEKMENIRPLYNKKRINEYDLDLIRNIGSNFKNESKNHQSPFETLKRFLSFKQNKINKRQCSFFEFVLSKLFPRIYSAKLIKKTISKMFELNIDTKTLLDKTIPYGENESRYEDLIKYINCANKIQTNLKKIN